MNPRAELFLTRLIPEPGPSLLFDLFSVQGNLEDRSLSREELLAGLPGSEVLLCLILDKIDGEVMDAAGTRLRVISNFGVGYDNIDVAAATSRGILVTNTPGVLTETTADLTWALILAAARRVAEGDALIRRGEPWQWGPRFLLGWDVHGKTLGVLGMGRIGLAVARRSLGFAMPVVYTRRSGPLPRSEMPVGAGWRFTESLEEILTVSDIVSVHVPLSAETRHFLSERELALMKPDSILINTSRGPVVDEAALVRALATGPPAAAGLDVYEDEPRLAPGLAELPNTVLLPHLGSASRETRARMSELAVRNAAAAVAGEEVPHPVNPEVLEDGRLPVR